MSSTPRPDVPHRRTLAIHAGAPPREPGAPVVPPVVQSATFFGGLPDDPHELRYNRYGNNPTQVSLAHKLAALEGAEAALALSSGMAAISLVLLALARQGDHVLSSSLLYGATRTFMEKELPRRGVEVSFVDPRSPRSWRHAIRPSTRALYLEVPVNPTLRIPDPTPVGQLGLDRGIPLVVDATFATPMNLRPLEHGADVVVHSATKYMGGHSDLTAGVVAGARPLVDEVTALMHLYGSAIDPHTAWLLDRGLRTLPVRMEAHNRGATELARRLQGVPGIAEVIHPSLPEHPDHALASELMDGPGGMLGVVLEGGDRVAEEVVSRLALMAVAPSLGGVETLVSLPHLTSHRAMSQAAREESGIPSGFIRISVGLEEPADLEADIRQALASRGG